MVAMSVVAVILVVLVLVLTALTVPISAVVRVIIVMIEWFNNCKYGASFNLKLRRNKFSLPDSHVI